ncbi:hypothetical protein AB2B38_003590 [Balneola sp. MJW-20]|uniref:hypothetical protein n=1 Tax=Gracilimonas aurantiaca TaxID=3234185 RepID=UPI003466F9DF
MANPKTRKNDTKPMFFSAFNYKLIGLSIFLIVAGFTAMYLENEINGFISLYISPIMVMAGYVIVIFAILKHNNTGVSPAPDTD